MKSGRPSREALSRFDAAAAIVGAWSRERYAAELRATPRSEQAALARMRYRWRLDEFAVDVMAPILAEVSTVSPPNALDEAIYGPPVYRVGARPTSVQRLVMTGRGVGKTTRQQIRRFHGLIYGCTRYGVSVSRTEGDAAGWLNTIHQWTRHEGSVLNELFPELRAHIAGPKLRLYTRFGSSLLEAKWWGGSLRGKKDGDRRPDALDLDDIESEESCKTSEAVTQTIATLNGKALPIVPLDGGAEVFWTQTPPAIECAANHVVTKHPELLGWDVRLLPVIKSWPTRTDLWAQAQEIALNTDDRPEKADRENAARAFYEANREAMDEGVEVLDPVRMGPMKVYEKLWTVGPTAFKREFEMSRDAPGQVFSPSEWPRHTVGSGMIHREGKPPIVMSRGRMWAHLDTSDGGDDGALVVCWGDGEAVYELASEVFTAARIDEQIAGVAPALLPFASRGLRALHWEPPPGAASIVEAALIQALRAAGLDLQLVPVPSRENKTARIVNTLEPIATTGRLSLRADINRVCVTQAQRFSVRKNNRDDWLDALQRCAEGLSAPEGPPAAPEFLAALARLGGAR